MMIDRTTAGHEAEPEEVEAVLHNLCGYHLAESDPLFRYTVLTREQVLYAALVAAIKRERGRALAELASGRTLTQVAEMASLGTRQRVQRLIATAKAADVAAAEARVGSLEFEERITPAGASYEEAVGTAAGSPVDRPPATVGVPPGGGPAADEAGTERDPRFVLEPTMVMPALSAVLHPTKELPPAEEGAPWWRRGRDTGAA
jgi:hypothetical protein